MCTSGDGTVHVADLVKPEDSYTAPNRLPLTASHIFFLPQVRAWGAHLD